MRPRGVFPILPQPQPKRKSGCLTSMQRFLVIAFLLMLLPVTGMAQTGQEQGVERSESVPHAFNLTPEQAAHPNFARILKHALGFRRFGVGDPLQLNKWFAGDDVDLLFQDGLTADADALDHVWFQFFHQTQFYIGNALSDRPVVGFYSPVIDYWYVTRWRHGAETRITDVALVSGDELRQGQDAYIKDKLSPLWMRVSSNRDNPQVVGVADGLQAQTATSIAAFLTLFPVTGETSQGAALFEHQEPRATLRLEFFVDRISLDLVRNGQFVAEDGALASYKVITNLLREGDWTGLLQQARFNDPELPGLLREIPHWLRENLQLSQAIKQQNTYFVSSFSADNARWMLLQKYSVSGESWRLENMTLIDLYAGIHGDAP